MNRFNAIKGFVLQAALCVLLLSGFISPARLLAQEKMTGKITLIIEKKTLNQTEYANAVANHTPIWLKVTMRMEGDWVARIESANKTTRPIGFDPSAMSFAIANSAAWNSPYEKNPLAYIVHNDALTCSNPDGIGTTFTDNAANYPTTSFAPTFQELHNCGGDCCPQYTYTASFSEGWILGESGAVHKSADGTYYDIDLFAIGFILKPGKTPGNVYVRGGVITGNPNRWTEQPKDFDKEQDGASIGYTQLNLLGVGKKRFTNDGYDGTLNESDWTYGRDDQWGGIIPGGIFIENDAEVTPLLPFLV